MSIKYSKRVYGNAQRKKDIFSKIAEDSPEHIFSSSGNNSSCGSDRILADLEEVKKPLRCTRNYSKKIKFVQQPEVSLDQSRVSNCTSNGEHSLDTDHMLFSDNKSYTKRKGRKPLKEINSFTTNKSEKKATKTTRRKKVTEQCLNENSAEFPTNLPDFEDIDKDELVIDVEKYSDAIKCSTPIGLSLKAKICDCIHRNSSPMQHKVHHEMSMILHDVENHGNITAEECSEISQVKIDVSYITSRRPKNKNPKSCMRRSVDKVSSDSGNLSEEKGINNIESPSPSFCNVLKNITSTLSPRSPGEESGSFSESSITDSLSCLTRSLSALGISGNNASLFNKTSSPVITYSKTSRHKMLSLPVSDNSRDLFEGSVNASNLSQIEECSEVEVNDVIPEEDEEEDEEEDDSDEDESNLTVEDEEEDEEEDDSDEDESNLTVEDEEILSDTEKSLQHYSYISTESFSQKLLHSSLCPEIEVTPEEKILEVCGQEEPISFTHSIPSRMLSKCVKIGEGVYGEVFRSCSNGQSVALKIIPIEGDAIVNECPQKKFEEILPEMVIAQELSGLALGETNQTENFCQVNKISYVKGKFPEKLLEQWDLYAEKKCSENDRPDMFTNDQLFIVFEFVDAGCALEKYKFSNQREAYSVLRQVVFALAVAEEALEFEHRDLHIGNVLVRPCKEETVKFKLKGESYEFPTEGVMATIIDFTISRLQKDGCAVFCDISTDEGLFEGTGDFQFDVYRDMRKENGNNWEVFSPHSNILWANYLCKKLVMTIKYKQNSRQHTNIKRHLQCMVDQILDYSSCLHLAEDSDTWAL